MPPFMSYVAYSTYNYRFADPSIGTTKYDNLRLVRAFEHGLDPASSEAGFVLTHVDMVKHSPDLIKGAVDMLNSCSSDAGPEDIVSDRLDGIRLHERHVLVRGRVEDNSGPVAGKRAPHLGLVLHVCEHGHRRGEAPLVGELALDVGRPLRLDARAAVGVRREAARNGEFRVVPATGLTMVEVGYPPDDEVAARVVLTQVKRSAASLDG